MTPSAVAPQDTLNCHTCAGQCCRYFALQIDTPETAEDYDDLRWYLAHQHVTMFIEGKDWYLQVDTPCRYLQADHGCAIYDRRPKICRDYGWDAQGVPECHASGRDCGHDAVFDSPEALEAYAAAHPLPREAGSDAA
jgi:uncharacterized protein